MGLGLGMLANPNLSPNPKQVEARPYNPKQVEARP